MYGVSPARLCKDLMTWTDLHLNEHVWGVLLILRCAFEFDRKPGEDKSSKVLLVLSTKSSMLKEHDKLHCLMEENQAASEEAEVLLF